jgi:hypothetical protein
MSIQHTCCLYMVNPWLFGIWQIGRLVCPWSNCPICMDDTDAFRLQHGKKVSFFYCHQRFPPLNHSFRNETRTFLKGKTVRKGPPKRKFRADIIKSAQWPEWVKKMVCLNVMVKITTGHIKVVFENSLMQNHWYYPTTSIWCTKCEMLRKASWACVLMLPVSWKITSM